MCPHMPRSVLHSFREELLLVGVLILQGWVGSSPAQPKHGRSSLQRVARLPPQPWLPCALRSGLVGSWVEEGGGGSSPWDLPLPVVLHRAERSAAAPGLPRRVMRAVLPRCVRVRAEEGAGWGSAGQLWPTRGWPLGARGTSFGLLQPQCCSLCCSPTRRSASSRSCRGFVVRVFSYVAKPSECLQPF